MIVLFLKGNICHARKELFKEYLAHQRRMLIFLGNKNGKKAERRWKTGGTERKRNNEKERWCKQVEKKK